MNENSLNYVSTSHLQNKEYSSISVIKSCLDGINIRSDIHSHPDGSDFPSGMDSNSGDIQYARWLESLAPTPPTFHIYLPAENRYIEYNSRSEKYHYPRFLIELKEIIIDGTKK